MIATSEFFLMCKNPFLYGYKHEYTYKKNMHESGNTKYREVVTFEVKGKNEIRSRQVQKR